MPQFRTWLRVFPWLIRSKEFTNYSYDVTAQSKATLAHFVESITGVAWRQALAFIEELENDDALQQHVAERTRKGPMSAVSDPELKPGKRLLYYVLIRALKPEVVVEAGVDKGLGSCIIASALFRNQREGHPGRLVPCDISPDSGWLYTPPYDSAGTLRLGDARKTIAELEAPIDLFIQDVAPEFERELLECAKPKLKPEAVLVSVWHTGDLMRFAEVQGLGFLVFAEQVENHWFGGSRLAVAFPKR